MEPFSFWYERVGMKGSFECGPISQGKWGGQNMLRRRGKGRANSPWLMWNRLIEERMDEIERMLNE